MNWMERETSLYKCHSDNYGRRATFRDILLTYFAVPHRWFAPSKDGWTNGMDNDLDTMIRLRTEDLPDSEKKKLKGTLQCFTPAALLASKKENQVKEINRTGIMQLDFDYKTVQHFEIEELKAAIFSLPFIALSSLSCSGQGIYALALIEEPERLEEYAEHCFILLEQYGIDPDTSKGKKPENLRYISYDSKMLVRDDPKPLKIQRFKQRPKPQRSAITVRASGNSKGIIGWAVKEIQNAEVGNRWPTVQKVAYTLGGKSKGLDDIKAAIQSTAVFAGVEEKYIECAEVCFNAGIAVPLVDKREPQ